MEPHVAELPDAVYRIGRNSDLLRFSEISPEDSELPRGGNRFDVPGGKVLYAASQVQACFGETLARFRPTPKIRAILAEEGTGNGFMVCGGVPQDWRLQRSVATIHSDGPLPFLDVEHPATVAYLNAELSAQLVALGYSDNIDVSDVRGQDRRLSRLIARFAYTAVDPTDGTFLYSGIRYLSRIDSEWENWAIFDGTDVTLAARQAIELDNPHLRAVAELFDLRPF